MTTSLKMSAFERIGYYENILEQYPIQNQFPISGEPAEFLKQFDEERRARFPAVQAAMKKAESVRKEVFQQSKWTLLWLNIGVGAFCGAALGFIGAGRFHLLAGLAGAVIGAVVGVVLGYLVHSWNIKREANQRALPEFQKIFEAETAWLEGKIQQLESKIAENPPEKEQLVSFKEHLGKQLADHKKVLAAKSDEEPAWLRRMNTWDSYWAEQGKKAAS